jgi:hypothetical protein
MNEGHPDSTTPMRITLLLELIDHYSTNSPGSSPGYGAHSERTAHNGRSPNAGRRPNGAAAQYALFSP